MSPGSPGKGVEVMCEQGTWHLAAAKRLDIRFPQGNVEPNWVYCSNSHKDASDCQLFLCAVRVKI